MSDTNPAEPLAERIESTRRHDPYITRHFEEIFSHEDNADVARMFNVGLAVNDPAAPVEEAPAASSSEGGGVAVADDETPETLDREGFSYEDIDGDVLAGAYVEYDCPNHGIEPRVLFFVNEEAALVPIEAVPGIIAWLSERVSRGFKARGGSA